MKPSNFLSSENPNDVEWKETMGHDSQKGDTQADLVLKTQTSVHGETVKGDSNKSEQDILDVMMDSPMSSPVEKKIPRKKTSYKNIEDFRQ